MTTLHRVLAAVACALCASPLRAQDAAGEAAPLPPELEALLQLPRWSASAAVEGALGYKDNLLLSSQAEEGSAFVRGGIELLLLNVPRGRVDYSFFAQAHRTRFLEETTVDHEAEAWVQSEIGYRLTDTLRLGLPLTGYYYDQVFDVSETDIERRVVELKVVGAMLGPTLRWAFHRAGWLEVQAGGELKRYDDRVNDLRAGEGTAQLGWQFSDRLEARLMAGRRWRRFDERVQYTAAGRPLPDTQLKVAEREAELRFDIRWDAARRWTSTVRVGALDYRDNGSDYFSYDQQRVSHELTWKGEQWTFGVEGLAERVEFLVQTVGIAIDPPARIKDEFSARLHIERRLGRRWTLLGGYTWERSRSNDRIASYRVNEGLLGARWSWEK